jgi:phosphoribosylamine---glycine ligase
VRILVVGGGGREHALVWKLSQNSAIDRLYAAPGNAGIDALASCERIEATDVEGILDLVKRESIDLTVVGPEAPLVDGLVDRLEERGHRAFGPTAAAARIEGSKVWAKELCERYGIPTGRSRVFTEIGRASEHLDSLEPPFVVKADGLAAGKGVTVAESRDEAVRALRAALVEGVFGSAGERVLVEEHLSGREVSALALTDGRSVIPLALAQDFKRAQDGDAGPNTGGMGAFSPLPFVDHDTRSRIVSEILEPTVRALAAEGLRYRGVLYAGVMLTEDGPKVLEFNCRFGDPEAQAVIPRLSTDLAEPLLACAEGNLRVYRPAWTPEACVAVVLASGGYPGEYRTGFPIEGLDQAAKIDKVEVFHAGTARGDGKVVTAGGRVLAVSARGEDLAEARRRAYEACARISFEGKHHRTDIAEEAAGG